MPVTQVYDLANDYGEPPEHMQQGKWLYNEDGSIHLSVILPERNFRPSVHIRAHAEGDFWTVHEDHVLIARGKTSDADWQKKAEYYITRKFPNV